MNVAFTICANNYLGHGRTLIESWRKSNPDIKILLFLIDEVNPAVDYSFLGVDELIEIQDVNIKDFDDLVLKFDITELTTVTKPYIFEMLFAKYKADKIIYVDADMYIFNSFNDVIDLLDQKNIIITPHILTAIDDDKEPTDFNTLSGGVFNLGFIALSDYSKVKIFLSWWKDRTAKYGYGRLEKNMFYDQIWINYVPCFYDNYLILKHPGYNMANWNLHERFISQSANGEFLVNEKFPLVFFHFSGYRFTNPEKISFYHTRYDFVSRPDLKPVFNIYQKALIDNKSPFLKTIPCVYYEKYKTHQAKLKVEFEKSRPHLIMRVFQRVVVKLKNKMKAA